MSWSEKFLDEVGIRGEQIPSADSPDSPRKPHQPRVCSDYFSLEDILVFWRSGAYKNIRYDIELTTGFAAITVLPAGTVGRGHP